MARRRLAATRRDTAGLAAVQGKYQTRPTALFEDKAASAALIERRGAGARKSAD